MDNLRGKNIFLIVGIIVSIIIGVFWNDLLSFSGVFAYLEQQIESVKLLAVSTTGIATAITAIPGDVGIPVAEQMMDFSTQFLFILIGLYLEKYILIFTGSASFYILLPLSAILATLYLCTEKEKYITAAKKICNFAVLIVATIPISIALSMVVEGIHDFSVEDLAKDSQSFMQVTEEEDIDEGFWEGLINGAGDIVDDIVALPENFIEQANIMVSQFIEGIAVMIITSCIIPIIVFIMLIWGSKMVLGLDIQASPIDIYKSRPKFKKVPVKLNKGKINKLKK